jgi:hypothetical protein
VGRVDREHHDAISPAMRLSGISRWCAQCADEGADGERRRPTRTKSAACILCWGCCWPAPCVVRGDPWLRAALQLSRAAINHGRDRCIAFGGPESTTPSSTRCFAPCKRRHRDGDYVVNTASEDAVQQRQAVELEFREARTRLGGLGSSTTRWSRCTGRSRRPWNAAGMLPLNNSRRSKPV